MPAKAKKPIIAVDIDDVLSASAAGFVEFSNSKWGTNLAVEDYDEDWAKLWQADHEATKLRAHEYFRSGVVGRYQNFDEALPVLQKLSERYELVIATSRVMHVQEDTTEWLERHYKGVFTSVHLAGIYDNPQPDSIKLTKVDLCKKIGASYLIDDQPKHCLAVAEAGITGLLFGNYRWNYDTPLKKGVVRVKDWQEILEYFDGQAA